jgi:diaminohydroxyphosphoribosylaminopyrimidine deaminase/5-amino-6-(5-phosphoribosylamino)uracil reductase
MRLRAGRPFVRLKTAASLDGRTALGNGESRWITGDAARRDVQRWRARSSAVLTGIGTVLADDPRLDVRDPPDARRQPLRVMLDSKLRMPPTARLLQPPGETLVFAASSAQKPGATAVRVEAAPAAATGGLDLAHVLRRLTELQVNELLVEAGATLSGAFLAAKLVDEWLLYVSPSLLGDRARALATLPVLERLDERLRYEIVEHALLGGDLRLRLRPVR